MKAEGFLAFDFGAESGRAILGKLDRGTVRLKEVHRFSTGMMPVLSHFHWNVYRLYEEMLHAIGSCIREAGEQPESVGIDSWGVDFGLLGKRGQLLGLPYCYRDPRTDGMMEEFFRVMPAAELYGKTGIQFMQFNTVFQLYSMTRQGSELLEQATDLLFMPDLFSYLLTGIKCTEFSFATTSQLYNPYLRVWDPDIFAALKVNRNLMQEVVQPGTEAGKLCQSVIQKTGSDPIPVIAVASHDTASAIAAIPAEGEDWAYISSGTWSLMGIESRTPIITETTLRYNITNEGGVGNTFRVLKNIMGLWLLQQCRTAWSAGNVSYSQFVEMAEKSLPFVSLVDPDHSLFLNPPDMQVAINTFCQSSGQPVPESQAATVRCILESLALKYRYTLDQLREISPTPIRRIFIIGGGVQNELLCRFTAAACGLPVITGPAEGTALGNILVQAMARGHLQSVTDIRSAVRRSFPSKVYEPVEQDAWEIAYDRFKKLLNT